MRFSPSVMGREDDRGQLPGKEPLMWGRRKATLSFSWKIKTQREPSQKPRMLSPRP